MFFFRPVTYLSRQHNVHPYIAYRGIADREKQAQIKTVADLLNKIKNETLYWELLMVGKRTLQIVLLKMQGYSTKEIGAMAGVTEKAVYKRLERLRKKLKPILYPFREI